VVYKLTPPAAGQTAWSESVLHTFAGAPDGAYPSAGLLANATGTLYGTTPFGGVAGCRTDGCGTVFEVIP